MAEGRAEELGHDPEPAGHGFDVVVARAFGAPAVVAECGAPFLVLGGRLIVSEPPDGGGERWREAAAPDRLAELGLMAEERIRSAGGFGFQVLRATGPCPGKYPRRTGIPAKRPLF